ncbi:MAG: hypothetical protein KDD33_09915 [Bdellovibrionales bacterium]|nr:hypothetical protein [Bdellovibrionales bacterium]
MAHIVPTIDFTNRIIRGMSNGEALEALIKKEAQNGNSQFHFNMALWLLAYKNGQTKVIEFHTDYQKSLCIVLSIGLAGGPILGQLEALHAEMRAEFERQWQVYLQKLPFQLLVPLLLGFFPSYVVLLFGPLAIQFFQEIAQ